MAGSIIQSNTENEVYSSENQDNEIVTSTNDKDKTPMCLVNELARFNKVFIITFLG